MNQKQKKFIQENTISLDEFSKDFTPEQNRIVEQEIANYDALQALKKARKELGLTQAELAQKANMPRTTITKVESGNYNPTLNTLANMAHAMGKSIKITLV